MRNKEKSAIAVRLENGEIRIKQEKNSPFPQYFNFFFLRGIVGLGYTLYDGVKALIWSSNQQLGQEEKLSKKEIILTLTFSFVVAILFFVAVPFFSARLIQSEGVGFNLLDGLFRTVILLGYIWGISLMKEVKTLFQYHGAEHKTIYCYEQGEELTVANVRKQSRFHPRCGTTFIFLVAILSIGVFSLISGPIWIKFTGRIVMLPLIAGIGYEVIKLGGKHYKNPLMKCILAPGLWLQRITTKEPTDKQIEVGIASLKAVVGN